MTTPSQSASGTSGAGQIGVAGGVIAAMMGVVGAVAF